MPRTRTTKKLAQRIDLNYFVRPAPFRRWKFWLSVAVPALATLWLGWHALGGDARVYSSGRMSPAHALIAARCETCHVRTTAAGFSARATDASCLVCHDGPPHHATAMFTPTCSSCHVEHRGAVRLAATADANCVQCHGDLHTRAGTTSFAPHITSFTAQHPEFAVLRSGTGDPTTIKLNHFRHMQPNLAGPNGPVQLACQDCHRTPADTRAWPYAAPDAGIAAGANATNELAAVPSAAYMSAPAYAKACAACHTLEFDKRFTEGVPHDKPEVIHAFLVRKFQAYISVHPAELRERTAALAGQPDRALPVKPFPAADRTVTPAQWVTERTADAEQLLWRKTCSQCHALDGAEGAAPPTVRPSNLTVRFMPHARFDHSAHQLLTCTSCHTHAATSQDSADLLLPGVSTCRQCHTSSSQGSVSQAGGTAESGCFECHTYHDASKRQPVPGRFSIRDLVSKAQSPFPGGNESTSLPSALSASAH